MNKKIFLLSVDGGGVRGKIVTTFLALLEKDLGRNIYNVFDFYAGTSTGALIVLGIVANQYSADDISGLYDQDNLVRIFKKSWFHIPLMVGAKYQGQSKRQLFNEIFGNKYLLELPKPILVTSYDCMNHKAVVFKSTGGSDSQYNPLVAEVADATTAAPTYFPSVVSSAPLPRNLIDGGISANNPGLALISEALKQGYSLNQIRLLSFGTGSNIFKPQVVQSRNWGALRWANNGLIDDFMLGDSSMADYECRTILGDSYLRVNGTIEVTENPIDDISTDNLARLENIGAKWYDDNKKIVLEFLQ